MFIGFDKCTIDTGPQLMQWKDLGHLWSCYTCYTGILGKLNEHVYKVYKPCVQTLQCKIHCSTMSTHQEYYLDECDSTSLPSNSNAPIWSISIEIHQKFLLGRLLLSALHSPVHSLGWQKALMQVTRQIGHSAKWSWWFWSPVHALWRVNL